ncbi:MAG: DNA topoisomerase 3 [Bacteroidaceae bacterium]|nr:DNA topoisomerase 3 [Bacteroidaceae bacterium]
MIVCIAEKPSVARDIAHVLGANQQMDGYMEGNGYQVTWTFGHLCELKEPHDYTPVWRTWSLSQLPMIPPRFGIKLKDDKGIEKQFATIERLMSQADSIINCGDAGQEGELIQRWVMQKAQAKCPVQRLWISSMTDEAIREGFQTLKDQSEYQSLYIAGLSRAVGDWLLGINATRLYTIKYGQNRQVLSIGRVQTPTLALIVNRQYEIDNFKPEPYWVLATIYRETTFTATKGKFTTKEEGEQAFATIEGKPFTVTKVEKKNGKEQPPSLYDLTSLQVDCNKKFSYSAEMTLNLIQSLYEKKFTTYPRVDTTFLPDDVYPKCPQTMNGLFQTTFDSIAPYAELIRPLGGKPLPKTKKVFDSTKVTDHHAIIPTGVPPRGLTDAERNVFDLVAKRFIAAFYPDCLFAQTIVTGQVEEVEFKVTGKTILEPGWRTVYAKDQQTAADDEEQQKKKEEERTLPVFTKGESGDHKPTLTEKWTTPPKPYTEATLLRAMETAGKLVDNEELRAVMKENGIGRPSTRAAIIETLFRRHYIKRIRTSIAPTPTGIELIGLIREDLLKSAELTGIWEKKLRDIERDKTNYNQIAKDFIDGLKQQVAEIVNQVMSDTSSRRISIVDEEPERNAKPKAATKGKSSTKPQDATKAKSSAKPQDATKAKSPHNKTATKPGEPHEGDVCPLCGEGRIIKGKTAYGCSRWKEGCTYRAPFEDGSGNSDTP